MSIGCIVERQYAMIVYLVKGIKEGRGDRYLIGLALIT
jgi:hypothetical protein